MTIKLHTRINNSLFVYVINCEIEYLSPISYLF